MTRREAQRNLSKLYDFAKTGVNVALTEKELNSLLIAISCIDTCCKMTDLFKDPTTQS